MPKNLQPVEAAPGDLGELRGLTTGDGLDISSTRDYVLIPTGAEYLELIAHTAASSAAVANISLHPYIQLWFTDDDGDSFTDYSSAAQDDDATTDVVLDDMDTAANENYLYAGCHIPFGGLRVDVGAANGTASVMTAQYWNGNTWVAVTISDGTASGGATLAVDGDITWTAPTNWARTPLDRRNLYWIRFKVSVQLDSEVELNDVYGIQSGSPFNVVFDQPKSIKIQGGPGGYSALSVVTDTGTGELVVNSGGHYETSND